MSIYNKVVRQQEKFAHSSQQTLQLSRNDKKKMTIKEVTELATGLIKVGDTQNKTTKLLIRGLDATGWTTVIGFDEDIKTIDEYIDYYENRVAETKKFDNFYQLQVTIISIDNNSNINNRQELNHYKVNHPVEGEKKKAVKKEVSKAIFKKPKK